MANKKNITLSSGIEERVLLLALHSVDSCLYDGNERVKTRRKNWSSS